MELQQISAEYFPEAGINTARDKILRYSIGDISKKYSVTHRALRFYESQKLINPRHEGRERVYGTADVIRLEMILKGKQLGFTLAEVREFMGRSRQLGASALLGAIKPEVLQSQITYLMRRREEIEAAIDELRKAHGQITV
jgi:DNA-binding transcriptional MerR regulator